MKIGFVDWLVVGAYFLFNLLIGLYYRKKGTADTDNYFVSGRNVSWWLAGTSMVAATFAADTPLAVTGFVANQGIAGNWFWWSLCLSGMMTVFLFARLWRRAEIVTDVQLVELRYGGKPAAFLRGFRALYFGLMINCLIVGWVNLAMEKILGVVLGITRLEALVVIFGIIAFTGFYTYISGLWGVLWTDFFQFILKMTMVTVLAYYAVKAVGGMHALMSKLAVVDEARRSTHGGSGSILSFIPDVHSAWMPFILFCAYIGLNWWANWYPGAEPGGGGYVAQRIFAAKNEKHSLWATLWFNIAQYGMRTWPWVVTALASVVLYPTLQDKEIGYIKVWVDYLPHAWSGLMLAAFCAAYMSTIATQLNWGSSYLVNDFYRRFAVTGRSEHHYVTASKMATVLLAIVGAAVSLLLETVGGAWQLLLGIGAGTGAVYLLRWYWWRINAWSEVSAMTAAGATTMVLNLKIHGDLLIRFAGDSSAVFAKSLLFTVAVTTVTWLVVTFSTAPESQAKLLEFYRRVRPSHAGWKPIAALAPDVPVVHEGWNNIVDWLLGCLMVYMAMFGIGKIVLGAPALGVLFLAISALSGYLIYWDFSRRGWEAFSGKT
ncbi:MAG TPA: sodium:solute symporter family protein [Terriglobia bacterium]|nr:sodium:solute symporter family protein [Terriglobia bacterium]